MRLFIGTSLDPEKIPPLQQATSTLLRNETWRAAPAEQWHVTALFIGERPSGDLEAIKAHVKRIAKGTPPIMLRNGWLCTTPKSSPRMLWVRFEPSADLNSLHHTLATALNAEPSKHYPYIPHITLARTKGSSGEVDGPLLLPELRLDRITLFQTELHPAGSIHHPLATWKLK